MPPVPPPDGIGAGPDGSVAPAADGQVGTGDGAPPAPAAPAAHRQDIGTGATAPPPPAADGDDGNGAPAPAGPGADGATAALVVPEVPQPNYQVSANSINAVLSLLRGWGYEG